jgi:hypothetical protein
MAEDFVTEAISDVTLLGSTVDRDIVDSVKTVLGRRAAKQARAMGRSRRGEAQFCCLGVLWLLHTHLPAAAEALGTKPADTSPAIVLCVLQRQFPDLVADFEEIYDTVIGVVRWFIQSEDANHGDMHRFIETTWELPNYETALALLPGFVAGFTNFRIVGKEIIRPEHLAVAPPWWSGSGGVTDQRPRLGGQPSNDVALDLRDLIGASYEVDADARRRIDLAAAFGLSFADDVAKRCAVPPRRDDGGTPAWKPGVVLLAQAAAIPMVGYGVPGDDTSKVTAGLAARIAHIGCDPAPIIGALENGDGNRLLPAVGAAVRRHLANHGIAASEEVAMRFPLMLAASAAFFEQYRS